MLPQPQFLIAGFLLANLWAGCYAAEVRPATEYKLPLRFEENRGQTDPHVKFTSRSSGYSLFLTPEEAVLRVARRKQSKVTVSVVRMRPAGARAGVVVEGESPLPGASHYLSGSDPARWRTGVRQYGRVRYRGVYPGIDLVYYGQGRELEYDLIVAPGADPSAAQFVVEGADRMRLDRNGDLVLETRAGEIRHRCPTIYQESGGQRRPVKGQFLLSGNRVRFHVEEYDRTRPLTIDPALEYATYLGGERNEAVTGLAVDSAGNAYVTGYTDSAGFPTTTGSYDVACGTDGNCNGGGEYNRDVFVTKINPTGTALVYSTFIGGRNNETPSQIIVDAAGNAYVAGTTSSPDFPATPGGYGGNATGFFVVKLNPSGSAPVFTVRWTHILSYESPRIAVDKAGAVYIAGRSSSGYSLPVTPGAFQPVLRGYYNAYVAKLNAAATALEYCTWLGGSGGEDTVGGLAVDSGGSAVVRGTTRSLDFPVTANAYKPVYPTGALSAGFVAKLNPSGSALIFGTFTDTLGSSQASIAIDSQQNVYVSDNGWVFKLSADGSTRPFVHSASRSLYIDPGDSVYLHSPQSVSRVTSSGVELLYSSSLPVPPYISALDSATNLYVVNSGTGFGTPPPVTPDAPQRHKPGGSDLFLAKINRAGGRLRFFPPAVTAIVPPGTSSASLVTKRVWLLSDGTPYPVEVPFSAVAAGGTWLSTSTSSGTAIPEARASEANISLNAGGVAAGTYSGTIIATSAGAENSPASLPVSLLATPAPFADFSSSYTQLSFQYVLGGTVPAAQSVWVYARNGGSPEWNVSASSVGWLSITPSSGTGSATLTVSVNPAGLAAGNYFGTIDLTTTGVGTTSLPVRLSITRPELSASPGSLSFTQTQGKPAPAAQSLSLSGSGSFTATVSGGTWLSLSQTSGTLPATLTLSVNASGLNPGTHRASVTVSSGSLGSITVPVTFVVIPPNQLIVSPASLNFSYWPGATTQSQSLSLTSDRSLNWSAFASSTGNWLSVAPSGGSTPGTLSVSVNPSGLAVGTHTGTIAIVATDAANSQQTITVTLVVTSSSPVTVTPSSLTFTTSPGVAPPAQSVSVTDAGGKSFTATVSHPWLSVTPTSGTMPATLSVAVNPAGLVQSSYSGSVTVNVTREDNTIFPVVIPVTLNLVQKNELKVTPGTLTFYAWAGTVVPIGGGTVTVTSDSSLYWQAVSDVPWMQGLSGSTPVGYAYPISISASSLPPGQYTGKLTFSSPYASNDPQDVIVNLTVLPSAPVSLAPSYISFHYQGGALPAAQTLSVTAPSAIPFTAAVKDGPWLSISPASGTTPATLTLTADPAGLAAGTHTATVTVSVTQGGVTLPVSVTVTLTVSQPQLQISGLEPYPFEKHVFFTWDPAGPPPQPRALTVSSSDESIVQTVTTTVWTDSGSDWLQLSPDSGTTPLTTRVSIKTDGLSVGTYTGRIAFASDKAGNNPQVVTVILQVGTVLRAGTSSLLFRYLPGGAAPDPQTVTIESGATPMQFTSTSSPVTSWLRLSPESGTTPADVKFAVDAADLPPGIYTTQVQFSSPTATSNQASVSVRLEVGPRITLSPGSVSFTAEPGSTAPQSRTVSLSAGGASLNYSIVGAGVKWLTVTPSSGVTPANLTLTANPSGLSAGEYLASVVVSVPDSADHSQTLSVSLHVGAKLAASQTSLSFQSVPNGPPQMSLPISVSAGATALPYSAWASAGGWLSVNPASGTTPGTIVATVNPAGLVAGHYSGTITISAASAINTITIPVSLTVGSAGAASFNVMPQALSFTHQAGAPPPAAQVLTVTSAAPFPITASASGGTWLSVTPQTGLSPVNFQVSINPAGLAAGVYTASVALGLGGMVAQTVPVTLTVQEGPQLLLSASSLAFAAAPGESGTPAQTVDVTSTGRSIAYRATSSATWLLASPSTGRTRGQISISVNAAGLQPGAYNGTISIASDEAGVTAQTIAVRLTVSSLPQLTVSPTTIHLVYVAGEDPPEPAGVILFSDARLSYTAQVASSGWLSASRESGRAPDLLEVAADPEGLKPGVYTGTLTLAAAGAANSPQAVTVKLTVKAPEPVVSPGGIVNTASYLYGAIAPGSLISIFGENLAPGTTSAESSPWPTMLNGVAVTINGIAAPLYYVSPDQINAQVPLELPIGLGRLVVTVNGRSSLAAVFPLTSAAPGIFYSSETRSAVQNADYSINSPENPAAPGSIVLAYLTGQGRLDMGIASGVAAPSSPLCRPTLPVDAVINDRPAEVLFSGMAPGLVGVMQVNLRIPDLEPGEHLLKITIGGVPSNSVPVTVAAPAGE